MSIIASASCRVHQQIPGITRIRTLGIDPRTGRCSLKSPSQETSQIDYHAIKANIIVGCHHWGVLWAINWLVEWPRTLTGALSLGVTNPNYFSVAFHHVATEGWAFVGFLEEREAIKSETMAR
uniref:Uncharacterized protein n=1 Tax=Salix viminalis TaxID=40686 RepID=A0A6N2LP05_SALVM